MILRNGIIYDLSISPASFKVRGIVRKNINYRIYYNIYYYSIRSFSFESINIKNNSYIRYTQLKVTL